MDDTTPPDSQPTPPTETGVAPTTIETQSTSIVEVTPAEALPISEPATTLPVEISPIVPEAITPEPTLPPAAPALTLEQMLARLSPTELKALFKKYLFEIGAKGRAKTKAQFLEKQQKIIAHIGIHGRITHKEAMQLTNSAKTTATRLLQSLEKEGRVVQHGGYKARDAYYSLRL